MLKHLVFRSRRIVTVLATVALVIQSFWPGSLLDISPAHAATGTWGLTDSGDYEAAAGITVDDTYGLSNLDFTAASDNLDGFGPTTDLVETGTAGRILAGVSVYTYPAPYSVDYGANWTQGAAGIGGEVCPRKFAKITNGLQAGRIVGVGTNDVGVGGWSYTDDDGASWVGHTTIAGTTQLSAAYYDSSAQRIWAGTDDVANLLYYSDDFGATFSRAGLGAMNGANEVHSITSSGSVIYVGTTIGVADATNTATFYSNDAGVNWTQASKTGTQVPSAALDVEVDSLTGYIYVVTSGAYIMRSTNGTSFSEVAITGLALPQSLYIDSSGGIFILDTSGSVFRSHNGGTTFVAETPQDTILDMLTTHAVIRMTNHNYLLATEGAGLTGNAYTGEFTSNVGSILSAPTLGVANRAGIAYTAISAFSETYSTTSEVQTGLCYRLAKTYGGDWYYWDGSNWSVSGGLGQSNTAAVVNANIAQFNDDAGSGTLYFQVMIFDNSNPYSNASVVLDSVEITYVTGTVEITAPNNGDEEWSVGTREEITWDYGGGFTGAESADLYYSTDSGSSWTSIISGTENDGLHDWQVPNDPSDAARVKIVVEGVEDTSDSDFRIVIPREDDTTPPISSVDKFYRGTCLAKGEEIPDEGYTNSNDVCITATASDNVGVKQVTLYYWTLEYPVIKTVGVDTSAPFEWDFGPGPGNETTFIFFTIAEDFKGNIESKGGYGGYPWERSFTTDYSDPYVSDTVPEQGQEDFGIDSKIILTLFDPPPPAGGVDPTTLDFVLYKTTTLEEVDMSSYPPTWKNGNTKLEFSHSTFDYDTWYTLQIYELQDLAGNSLEKNAIDPLGTGELVWLLAFKTTVKIDPDLTSSTIEVVTNPPYSPGDTLTYKVTIINTSDQIADNASADLVFANGLTYVANTLVVSSGNVTLNTNQGVPVGWTWTGSVAKGTPVIITYDVTVDSPAYDLEIEQSVTISDNVNPDIERSVAITISEDPNFSTSTKVVDEPVAGLGDPLKYTITVKNTGDTPATTVNVIDDISDYTSYTVGSLKGVGWDELKYTANDNGGTITAQATNMPINAAYTIEFWVVITAEELITNIATIDDPSDNEDAVTVQAQTDASEGPDEPLPPKIIGQSPMHNSMGLPLQSTVVTVTFSKNMNPDSLVYSVKRRDLVEEGSSWTVAWSDNDTTLTLAPPSELEIGTTYTAEIIEAYDINGNALAEGGLPNPWSFTTVQPAVTIVAPEDPVVEIPIDTVSPQFVIEIQDAISGDLYPIEDESIDISWHSTSPTGRFGLSAGGFSGSIDHITLQQGESQAYFYYIDGTLSPPDDYTTITVYENSSKGWGDSTKYVVITGEEGAEEKLVISAASTNIYVGQFSQPIIVSAKKGDQSLILPRLYFYTQSSAGTFYDSTLNPLPEWITAQAVGSGAHLQYFDPNPGTLSVTFYYQDAQIGKPLITVADNAPLAPDIGYKNSSAVFNVLKFPEEEELEEELEEVEDDTGRILNEVIIKPSETALLPGGIQTFEAIGYDLEGKEIDELIFRWYAIGGGGTIQKEGLDSDSHVSVFTAGNELGVFYDTVLVATLYNGTLGFATATVIVVDIADYGGPARLPTTGISSLQIIFLGLTLAAAVALAWVTSYEKTHFKEKR